VLKEIDVKKMRQRLGLTQDEFAVKLGVAPFTVRRWEAGATSPSRLARKAIEGVFGVILDINKEEWHEHPLLNGSYHKAVWCYVWSSTDTVGEIPPEAPIQCSVCGKIKGG